MWTRIGNTAFKNLGLMQGCNENCSFHFGENYSHFRQNTMTYTYCKNIFFIFFSYNLPAGTSSSVLKKKCCVKILFFKHYFSPLITFMRKVKDPEPDPDL
jgi:hypothetical protein